MAARYAEKLARGVRTYVDQEGVGAIACFALAAKGTAGGKGAVVVRLFEGEVAIEPAQIAGDLALVDLDHQIVTSEVECREGVPDVAEEGGGRGSVEGAGQQTDQAGDRVVHVVGAAGVVRDATQGHQGKRGILVLELRHDLGAQSVGGVLGLGVLARPEGESGRSQRHRASKSGGRKAGAREACGLDAGETGTGVLAICSRRSHLGNLGRGLALGRCQFLKIKGLGC